MASLLPETLTCLGPSVCVREKMFPKTLKWTNPAASAVISPLSKHIWLNIRISLFVSWIPSKGSKEGPFFSPYISWNRDYSLLFSDNEMTPSRSLIFSTGFIWNFGPTSLWNYSLCYWQIMEANFRILLRLNTMLREICVQKCFTAMPALLTKKAAAKTTTR